MRRKEEEDRQERDQMEKKYIHTQTHTYTHRRRTWNEAEALDGDVCDAGGIEKSGQATQHSLDQVGPSL